MEDWNPWEAQNLAALAGGVTECLGARLGDADCQNMFPSGESVFKRLTHLQGSYAASTMGNSLFTKDILVRDVPMNTIRVGDFFFSTVLDEFARWILCKTIEKF